MTGIVRARYTLEFKQEAARLVRGGQSLSSVARGLGISAQSIDNWVKADAIGGLKEAKGKPVNADQMEIVSSPLFYVPVICGFTKYVSGAGGRIPRAWWGRIWLYCLSH